MMSVHANYIQFYISAKEIVLHLAYETKEVREYIGAGSQTRVCDTKTISRPLACRFEVYQLAS